MDPEVLNLGEKAGSVNMGGLFWLEKGEGQDYGGAREWEGELLRWLQKAFGHFE